MPHPPRVAEWIVAWSTIDRDRQAAVGDLAEEFVTLCAEEVHGAHAAGTGDRR